MWYNLLNLVYSRDALLCTHLSVCLQSFPLHLVALLSHTCYCVKGGLKGVFRYVLLVSCLEVQLVCLTVTLHLERYAIIGTEIQIHALHTGPALNAFSDHACSVMYAVVCERPETCHACMS